GSARRLRRVRATSRQLVSEHRRGRSSGARVSDESCLDPDAVTAPRPRMPRWREPSANSASAPAPARAERWRRGAARMERARYRGDAAAFVAAAKTAIAATAETETSLDRVARPKRLLT